MSALVTDAVEEAVDELVPLIGAKAACEAVGVPRASYYRARPAAAPQQASEPPRSPLGALLGAVVVAVVPVAVAGGVVAGSAASSAAAADVDRRRASRVHTPADVHYARAHIIREARGRVLDTAYATHPERFVRKAPEPPKLPQTVWINKPEDKEDSAQ